MPVLLPLEETYFRMILKGYRLVLTELFGLPSVLDGGFEFFPNGSFEAVEACTL